ncbi:MAG TPA: M15 family metallopeptidase [Vicinamibacterales bacterium]|nr:M15 family metallopeptidase [Vicinamibacterales bacterium]
MIRTVLAALLFTLAQTAAPPQVAPWPREPEQPDATRPKDPPQRWLGLIGEYGEEAEPLYVLERSGRLFALFGRGEAIRLDETSRGAFRLAASGAHANQSIVFSRDPHGHAIRATVGDDVYDRREVGPAEGSGQLRVQPVGPVADLLKAALAAEPPKEPGEFRQPDLVELVKLDPAIKLDIRYATTNNFLGSVFYAEARAFLQRPAAEAVVRVHRKLKSYGYGLLIHDGYRPWYVTKTFWDATPPDKRWLVANPATGSRHNRGAAVDLTLYDLKTGLAVEMPSTYDESTPRAYAFYPGGTDVQRWRRALLRRIMEAEGFTVNPNEWWHFDYKDWQHYAIGNVPFDRITWNQ